VKRLTLAVFLLSSAVHAEDNRPCKIDFALLSADLAVRNVDVVSTRVMLERGNRELFLPPAIAHHTAAMALYSNAVVAANWYAARTLEHHGHKKLARALLITDIAQDGFWAFHNFTLPASNLDATRKR